MSTAVIYGQAQVSIKQIQRSMRSTSARNMISALAFALQWLYIVHNPVSTYLLYCTRHIQRVKTTSKVEKEEYKK